MNIIKNIFKYLSILILLILSLALLGFYIITPTKINYNISQKIGGSLIVEGFSWMDLHSFGDMTTITYLHNNSNDRHIIGHSDYYGREFNQSKQIIYIDDTYMLSAGDRLDGDKIFVSKDLKQWTEFTFLRSSELGKECQLPENYLQDWSPDDFFVHDNFKSVEWIRRIGDGSDFRTQKIIFTFNLNWNNNKIICKNIISNIKK